MLNKGVCRPGEIVFSDCEEIEEDFDIDLEKGLCPREDFLSIIKRFRYRQVTVEFECAGCCKKGTGILQCADCSYVLLTSPSDKPVLMETYCPGLKETTVECVCQAVIRFDKIISVELAAE